MLCVRLPHERGQPPTSRQQPRPFRRAGPTPRGSPRGAMGPGLTSTKPLCCPPADGDWAPACYPGSHGHFWRTWKPTLDQQLPWAWAGGRGGPALTPPSSCSPGRLCASVWEAGRGNKATQATPKPPPAPPQAGRALEWGRGELGEALPRGSPPPLLSAVNPAESLSPSPTLLFK